MGVPGKSFAGSDASLGSLLLARDALSCTLDMGIQRWFRDIPEATTTTDVRPSITGMTGLGPSYIACTYA